jgi:hypothetical protein
MDSVVRHLAKELSTPTAPIPQQEPGDEAALGLLETSHNSDELVSARRRRLGQRLHGAVSPPSSDLASS